MTSFVNVTCHRGVDLSLLAEVVFVRVLDYKVPFYSPFAHWALWREVIGVVPSSGTGELWPPSWRAECPRQVFRILLPKRFVPSPALRVFIYSIVSLHEDVCMNIYFML